MLLFRKHPPEAELDAELRAHLDLLAAEKARGGLPPDEARRAALLELEGLEQVKECCRDARRFHWLDGIGKDIHYAARALRKTPAFTAAGVLILSLGMGAAVAVFSVVDAVLLKPLPVRAPEQLVWFDDPSFSYPIFQEVKARGGDLFSGLFAWNIETVNVDWRSGVEQAPVLFVTGEFYEVLGVLPAAGRLLDARDGAPVAVISHSAWERRFGRDPAIVGKTVRVERVPFTIVGVAPQGFFGVAPGLAPEITAPLTVLPTLRPQDADLQNPHMAWLHMMGRLRPGLSRERANAAVQVIFHRVMEAVTDPSMPRARRATFLGRRTQLLPGAAGFSRVRNRFSQPLRILFALVCLLLAAACATVANLLLMRATSRSRETAVRLAIGAGRGRLVRQLLIESCLLTAGGAAGALIVASWGGQLLAGLMTTTFEPIAIELTPDWRVLTFTLALGVAVAVAATVLPSLRAAAIDPGPTLKDSSRAPGRRPGRLLVLSQVALAVLLLAGAALFARSLQQLASVDPGFEPRGLLLIHIDPVAAGYRDARLMALYATLQERLSAAPGVDSVSLSWAPPVSNEKGAWTQSIGVDGAPPEAAGQTRTFFNVVSPAYFATIGQRLLRGRDFGPRDQPASPRVCIVTESVAQTFFPGRDPLGRHISVGRNASRRNLEIVGVVADARYQRLQEPTARIVYLPHLQSTEMLNASDLVVEVRSQTAITEPLRRELRHIDANLTARFETMSSRVRESLVTERVVTRISAFLGAVALLLAAGGLYGLLAYSVSLRTAEMGIRMALGAQPRSVRAILLKDALRLTATGAAAGCGTALLLARYVEKLLYGIAPHDPLALVTAAAVMLTVATAAAIIPAHRAARIDPMAALRHE